MTGVCIGRIQLPVAGGRVKRPTAHFVLTGIANYPNEEESLGRLMISSNEFDVEGLIATAST